MGRTYEALSHSRTKREREAVDEGSIPPTAFLPIYNVPSTADAVDKADSNPEVDMATADTAIKDELSKDNNEVPYIEVGGPKGSKPIYGPLVGETAIQNPLPLRLEAAEPVRPAISIASVAFFPLPERPPLDPQRVARELVVLHQPEHAASAQYRGILAGMTEQHSGIACPLLIFTTVGHATEAATVVLNLAVTRARDESKRILVIEANHERPLIASRLGIASQPGLRELLNRTIPFGIALHATAQPKLFALPPGDPDRPVSHEAEARLPDVINQLRQRFDWLLVNGPEWGSGGASEWAGLGDAAYLVVRHDQWDTPEVEAAHEAMLRASAKLRGYITLKG